MSTRSTAKSIAKGAAIAGGIAAAEYGLCAGVTWLRYGSPRRPRPGEEDAVLDEFMPRYDIVERHHVRIAAPADVTLDAARQIDLMRPPISRAIFKAREWIVGATPDEQARPRGLLAFMQSIGWGMLADVPGREVVLGSVTQPWEANVIFRPLPAGEFAAFHEPGFVKIVWTLRADALDATHSMFRTETRAIATDAAARRKFRRYWSLVSPGIVAIRLALLAPLKKDAERRARADAPTPRGSGHESSPQESVLRSRADPSHGDRCHPMVT